MRKKKAVFPQTIYIGPTVRGLGLIHSHIYSGKAKLLDGVKEKFPSIERLIVPVTRLSEAEKNLQTKGTPEYLAFLEIKGGK